ncbi:hypothetical protein C7U92_27720 [Bradyrhizobium sp. WBOS7]|uniref:DUF983 domain-containing protein n=2 Tax=Nitrobacteraceae TaxID=41294 RepID=A0AAE9SUU0_9BRAD|nr:hypothetical protein [Bradyrhizobium sp. WBOS2]MDD1535017.1 hypothetical protein [Bradyrhizobium sp. WBOS8]MDD1574445.1 hypothetical protein [Bradyrhizobium sp. WBOS1]MDD1580481.1 hypothetical protein [Bradyrhizobium sp. WBOS7]MDD1584509.1 hypothetical protein [Bradyrhizobium sp. WBOS4]MDD1604166.1 hypothetical protein [Bradyrhizobium sp. WBOS16]UUO35587.1 hypothetical protein DCK84_14110 [Bradyrhizobium sp. WBOS01]UUO41896.1 hypothetical protein DCM75_14865 [Bradyrhizobium sp. WBOS02]UU
MQFRPLSFECMDTAYYCMGRRKGRGVVMAAGSVSLGKAMWRGFRGKCPNCGEGHLFGRFLKVADRCDHCGEELFHQRADDFPAYLVMVVVGHLVVPAILAVETAYAPPEWLQLAVWLPVTLFASLALLQPTKGAIVGLQWQLGMHGFEAGKLRREAGELAPVLVKADARAA